MTKTFMLLIKKSQLHELFNQHQATHAAQEPSPFISALNAFLNNLNKGNQARDRLKFKELFDLLNILLANKIMLLFPEQKNPNERLAISIENLFGKDRMHFFHLCYQAALFNQAVVNFVCSDHIFRTLPNNINDVMIYLEKNDLLVKTKPDQPENPATSSEETLGVLEKTGLLSNYLSNQDIGRASTANKHFHVFFQPALKKKMAEAAAKLGEYIVYANLESAKQMIIRNPNLLTIPVTVNDYANREITGTALQLALGAKDVKCHEDQTGTLLEMIMRYLSFHFLDGKTIIAQQINEQFPAGWETAHQARVERDQAALNTFVQALVNSENPADWEEAAVVYRNHFHHEHKNRGIIKTGFHHHDAIVTNWLRAHLDHFHDFGNRIDSPKNIFLWEKGSYCQRDLTAVNGMFLTHNTYSGVIHGQSLERRLDLLNVEGSLFPLDLNPNSRLGYDYAVGLEDDTQGEGARWRLYTFLTTYNLEKDRTCRKLIKDAAETLVQKTKIEQLFKC